MPLPVVGHSTGCADDINVAYDRSAVRFRWFEAARKLNKGPGRPYSRIGEVRGPSEGPSEGPVTDTKAQGPRILVVDDNDDNRYTLTLYLNLESYGNIEVAEDGEAAIAWLERESFDLVLLDVMMPK